MKKIAQNVKLSIIILSLILVIGIISVIFFIDEQDSYPNPYYKIDSRIENIEEEGKAFFATVGWIKVQGTNIDYPVIRETTEDYFSGLDYLWQPNNSYDTENRMTIYGHNIQNVSSRPLIADPTHTRFEQLMSFVDEKFAKKNLYIQYTKDGKDDLYKIYAVSFHTMEEEGGDSIADKKKLDEYIKTAKKNSIYDYDVEVDSSDNIISLITCTRYFGLDGKTQFKVDARKVRENEEITHYKVKINQNYDIIK